jgi:hypothetical protein
MLNFQTAAVIVKQAARMAAYDNGAAMTFADVRELVPANLCDRFVAEQAELAGFPVWTSVPNSLFNQENS